jgi:dipeptidyl aminopeptidase/acylaminoacyl peptidase
MTRSALSIFCLFLSLVSWAQTNTLTPEMLFDFGRVALEDVSPDGRAVLYTVTRHSVAKNNNSTELCIMPVSGGAPQVLAAGTISNARFSSDGTRIGFMEGDKLVEIKTDGTDKRERLSAAVNGFGYLPLTNAVYYSADVKYLQTPQEKYPDLPSVKARVFDDLLYRHWKSWEDYHRANVFIAELGSSSATNIMQGEPFDVPLMPMGGMEQIAASPDGRYIAYTCKKLNGKAAATSTNSDIFLYDISTNSAVNISAKNKGYDMNPVFSADGLRIAWNRMSQDGYEAGKNQIIVYTIVSGRSITITDNYDNDAGMPVWSPDGTVIYSITTESGLHPVYAFDTSNPDKLPVRISKTTDADFRTIRVAGTLLVAEKVSMSAPVELVTIDIKTGTDRPLTNVNSTLLAQLKMGKVQRRMVTTTDKQQMLAYVVTPPDFNPARKYPTLLYCQGGPQSPITQSWSYRWNPQLMAAQGYVVVMPCRRGMQGFGSEWNEEISGHWGGQAMQDLLSAIDDVAKEPWVDKNRLGAVGASFGGYSVYWLAGNHNKRFKAFIAHCGVFNLESMYGTTEEIFFTNWDLGGPYWQNPSAYDNDSPHKYVSRWDTPILVIHGEKDFRVPVSEGLQAYQAAQLRGIRSRLLYFDDEGHWVSKPQNALMWHREFFSWLEEFLQPGE